MAYKLLIKTAHIIQRTTPLNTIQNPSPMTVLLLLSPTRLATDVCRRRPGVIETYRFRQQRVFKVKCGVHTTRAPILILRAPSHSMDKTSLRAQQMSPAYLAYQSTLVGYRRTIRPFTAACHVTYHTPLEKRIKERIDIRAFDTQ